MITASVAEVGRVAVALNDLRRNCRGFEPQPLTHLFFYFGREMGKRPRRRRKIFRLSYLLPRPQTA